MAKYYVDTLIWRDYYENRKDRFRPLGEWALEFFKKAMQNEDLIYYSDFVEDELKEKYSLDKIKEILQVITKVHLIKKVETFSRHFKEAFKISRERSVPFGDAFHAIVARDINAIIITRDHHFEQLQDIAVSKKPEELL